MSPNASTDKQPPRSGQALETDISILASILSKSTASSDAEDIDVAELLSQLETANGIAEGVESRLDGILQHLDGMLHSLESNPKDAASTLTKDIASTAKPSAPPNDSDAPA
ncbi:hypothetical protein NLI96_g11316 [Meripilus lineatus]|uniref:Uncharacterized protein n=1 Tax=Meripilus lineatus TaxID=2056292 RepID=A0AAD5UTF2_9APHY|nr:hypothetical protein NLI96_g11316 [Physisporinus lineatus]